MDILNFICKQYLYIMILDSIHTVQSVIATTNILYKIWNSKFKILL